MVHPYTCTVCTVYILHHPSLAYIVQCTCTPDTCTCTCLCGIVGDELHNEKLTVIFFSFPEKDCNPPSMTSTPVADSDKIPIPPPPPPIPFSVSKSSLTPLASHVPPPPPTPRVHSMELDSTNNSDFSDNLSAGDGRAPLAINHSRDMLQKMQSRLRKKMKKRGGVGGAQDVETTGGETKDEGKLDVRVRKMTAHATLQVLYKDIFFTMIYMYIHVH